MQHESHKNGHIAELAFELKCAEAGIPVSKPTSNMPYDYIIDLNNRLKRVQIKCAYLNKERGGYKCKIVQENGKSYKNLVDIILIYIKKDNIFIQAPILANKNVTIGKKTKHKEWVPEKNTRFKFKKKKKK